MSYGQSEYGILLYGQKENQENDISIYTPDLMSYLPSFLHDVREIEDIEKTLGEEIGLLKYAINDLFNQYFIESATWALSLWEKEYGLPIDENRPYVIRREMILAKIRGAGTTTKEMIQNMAMAFSGGEVRINEFPNEYRFEVQFVGVKGIPPNMAGLIKSIEDIKPAHLAYDFRYTYTVWNMLSSLTWQQVNTKTWNDLRVYEQRSD